MIHYEVRKGKILVTGDGELIAAWWGDTTQGCKGEVYVDSGYGGEFWDRK